MNRADLHGRLLRELEDPCNGRTSASVIDLADGSEVLGYNEHSRRLLASVTKIFSMGAILESLGPSATVFTEIMADTEPDDQGLVDGDLYIVGRGDPTIGSLEFVDSTFHGRGTPFGRIVNVALNSGVRRINGGVVGDGSYFSATADASIGLSALSVEHSRNAHPAFAAAQHLGDSFVNAGIEVAGPAREGTVDLAHAVSFGRVASPPMIDMLTTAGHNSDNRVMEALTMAAALQTVDSPSSSRISAEFITQHAERYGAAIEVVNASGLGTANFASPADVTRYLVSVTESDFLTDLVRTLPRAGHEGTLRNRMRNTVASQLVRAKTGTLTKSRRPVLDALAGYVFGSHRSVAFSIAYEEPEARYASKSSIDRVTESLARFCE